MHMLRSSFWLSRLVLAWFVLTMGVSIAAPFVQPQSLELVCSASGEIKWVQVGADTDSSPDAMGTSHHHIDCALCLSVTAPPPLFLLDLNSSQQSLSYALRPVPAAHIASVTRAPLPARGPPFFS
ncbi:DUF2946 family protein [Comamonas resistens]|uniref:DUF2946 family protein n=1 Tax=Comamonas resistens TaxID=3046670 RepID=A0ABY8SKF0_9BURK|nr:DUF2946 family protein [Comamonas resistens]MDL5034946.1 DUF2946 family protein [Comamonas resistens]WHS63567.1 DUF2946 family protein [Comamonas resistens]